MLEETFVLIKENVFSLSIAFIIGGMAAWLVSKYAFRIGLLDRPNIRSSHSLPTPKGGGLGISIVFCIFSIALGLPLLFWLPVFAVSMLSLVGDRIDIAPYVRLIVQFGAAFLVLLSLLERYDLSVFHFGPDIWIVQAFYFLFASIFIVGTANFYNFMDGINGIAGLTGVVAFGLLALYGIDKGVNINWILLCFGILMSCIGFLPFNFPNARVFMGDVGSVLLGFLFAVLVLVMAKTFWEFALLASFMFPFYADELITMAERIKDGWSLTKPHRRHLYQVLANEAGISHWKVSLGYGVFQLSAGIVFWKALEKGVVFFILSLVFAAIIFLFANYKTKARFYLAR